jgi:predicted RNA-binding Zn ribbon-like protein
MGRRAQSPADETELQLVGGALCLDFVNTVDPRHGRARTEYLTDYTSLVSWAAHAGAINAVEAGALQAEARRRPQEAARVHRDAIALREHAYEIFHAIVHGHPPPSASVRFFNDHHARASTRRQVVVRDGALEWVWTEDRNLERILWPVLGSMADLLTGPVDRVRECPGDGTCSWLFLDTTKNRSRKWCEMKTCGNRAKARRHYLRSAPHRPGRHRTSDVASTVGRNGLSH